MKKRYQDGGEVDEMEEANNRSIVPRKRPYPSPNDESGKLQNLISAGSDIVGRPQDEGYRPNEGTAMDRAIAEGARDSGKITESGDQSFGGAGSSRTVKATPKAMPKAAPKPQPKAEVKSTPKPAPKTAEMPADVTKMSLADRAKASREKARSGSGTTDTRSVSERIRSALAGKDRGGNSVDFGGSGLGMKSGGITASSRGDGIAQRGKTRGKMC